MIGRRFKQFGQLLVAVTILTASGCGRPSPALVVWTFPGYIDDISLAGFEQESGIKVELRGIGDVLSAMNKVRAGEYVDVFMSDLPLLGQLTHYGLLLPLERSRLDGWNDIWPHLRDSVSSAAAEGLVLGVPYMFGATGLGVRTDAGIPPDLASSWSVLWSPQLKGRVAINARLLGLLVVLLEQRVDFEKFVTVHLPAKDAVYSRVLARALELRSNALKTWSTANDIQELLRSGQVVATDIWDGPGRQLQASGLPVKFDLPSEGGVGWCDLWVVSSGARNVDGAYAFLNYLERPEVVARTVASSKYSRANRAGMMKLPKETRELVVYSEEEMSRIRHLPPIPPNLQLAINEILEEIQLGR